MAGRNAQRPMWDRVGGVAVAVLGVAVLVVAIVALRHPQGHSAKAGAPTSTPTRNTVTAQSTSSSVAPSTAAPSTQTPSSPSTSASPSVPASGKAPLVVLNQTSTIGLAAKAAASFQAGGWTVTSVGSLRNDVIATTAYYDPTVAGAQAAAEALQVQFPGIKRVLPKFAELPAGPIVVVLTSDYAQ